MIVPHRLGDVNNSTIYRSEENSYIIPQSYQYHK